MARGEILLALAATALTGLACFGVAELWLRVTKPFETPAALRAASLEYEVSVLSRHLLAREPKRILDEAGRVRIRIGARGYRGPDVEVPKPPGRLRIIVLGGSAAFDVQAREGRDWPRLLEKRLRQTGHPEVEVVNAAVPGHATWDLLGRLYGEVWLLEPDIVLVYEAWNDIKYFPWLSPDRSLVRSQRPALLAGGAEGSQLLVANPLIYDSGAIDGLLCHSQLYVRLRRRYWWWRLGEMGLEGLLRGPDGGAATKVSFPDDYTPWGPRQYELDLRLLAAAARDVGATPVLLTQARLVGPNNGAEDRRRIAYDYVGLSHNGLVRAFAECDVAVRRAGAAEGVAVIDVSGRLSGRSELFADHVHTTSLGSKAIARTVAHELAQLLSRTAHASPRGHLGGRHDGG